MPETQTNKPVSHIYAFAISWWFFVSLDPVRDVWDLVAWALLSLIVALVVRWVLKKTGGKKTSSREQTAPVAVAPSADELNAKLSQQLQARGFTPSGNAEVDAMLSESVKLLGKIDAAKNQTKNENVTRETAILLDVSYKILSKLHRHPELDSAVKRFASYYLPTTAKMVENYRYMEGQGITGDNISSAMEKIETALPTLVDSFKKQLDALFSETALDLSLDIGVMEDILKQEGLTEKTF